MNKALIVIDIQNDITKIIRRSLIISTALSTGRWRMKFRLFIYGMRIYHREQETFKPNTRGSELACDLKIVSDCIFTKYKGNALTSEAFSDFVRKHGITDFYLTGADACACVKSTCYNC